MIKHFKYLFVAISTLICINASNTQYNVDTEDYIRGTKVKFRNDTILISSAGGFQGYTPPSKLCQELHINFVRSGTSPAANITTTSIDSLPNTVKTLWIEGDARGFETLVSGGSQYSLPTPAAGTIIRFSLTHSPTTSPLAWFKNSLPAGCWVAIEPGSADPFIKTVLPLAGSLREGSKILKESTIFVGSSITTEAGFSAALATAMDPVNIQRHPDLSIDQAYTAPLILSEDTVFPSIVNGISLDGQVEVTFGKDSFIVNPTVASGQGEYFISDHRSLKVYTKNAASNPLPSMNFRYAAGGTASAKVVGTPAPLPITSF